MREREIDHNGSHKLVVFSNYLESDEVFALSWDLPCNNYLT